ncbi:CRTAC1 family protein [Pirellulaceae bacterium SH449]
MRLIPTILTLVLLFCGIESASGLQDSPSQQPIVHFKEMLGDSGIEFVHENGARGERYVVEPMASGLALFDFDNDGLIDIYFVNGSELPPAIGTDATQPPCTNRLYRNLGNFRFVDVTETAGVGDVSYGLGAVAGDYDNDGDLDLYVSNFGENVFYENNGDGTFTAWPSTTLIANGPKFSAGACFIDIDQDGNLDLYVANYQKFTFDKHFQQRIGDYLFHPGPKDFPPEDDFLFRNLGDGTFQDISLESGIRVRPQPGMGVIAGDFDGDGHPDILVANDSFPNFLFINDGTGKFTEDAAASGVAIDRAGRSNGNMGIEAADLDGDLLIDFFTTTYQEEMPVLYRQIVSGLFEDVTHISKIETTLYPHVNWGVGLEDFDNDGDIDIFVACGHFLDNIQYIDDRTKVKVRNYLLRNNGKGRFTDATLNAGPPLQVEESSRAAGFDDLDNDGRIDIVVLNAQSKPQLLRNQLSDEKADSTPNSWLQIQLVGTSSNRDACGAKVIVRSNIDEQIRMVHLGRGYQSHYGKRLHFGLGVATQAEVIVTWPNDQTTTHQVAPLNAQHVIIEPILIIEPIQKGE